MEGFISYHSIDIRNSLFEAAIWFATACWALQTRPNELPQKIASADLVLKTVVNFVCSFTGALITVVNCCKFPWLLGIKYSCLF